MSGVAKITGQMDFLVLFKANRPKPATNRVFLFVL